MSTRNSIKWKDQTPSSPGYHLYEDCLDFGDEPPVYLRLEGVQVELETLGEYGAAVTLTLPRRVAVELGLLPDEVPGETNSTQS
jgi:hypothetical protein